LVLPARSKVPFGLIAAVRSNLFIVRKNNHILSFSALADGKTSHDGRTGPESGVRAQRPRL
jgi:hypothetical protein